jgi:hypothetical protein
MQLGLHPLDSRVLSSPAVLKIVEWFYGPTTVFPAVGTNEFFTPSKMLFGTSHGPWPETSWRSLVGTTKLVSGRKQWKANGYASVTWVEARDRRLANSENTRLFVNLHSNASHVSLNLVYYINYRKETFKRFIIYLIFHPNNILKRLETTNTFKLFPKSRYRVLSEVFSGKVNSAGKPIKFPTSRGVKYLRNRKGYNK